MERMDKMAESLVDKADKMETLIEKEEIGISIEEFSIAELEDRLEFTGRCNNCRPEI
jgi:hypothetical protein